MLSSDPAKESAIEVYFSRQMSILLLMAFSSGLPYELSGELLRTWMTTAGIDIGLVGLAGLVAIPYTWKFVWSPLMDRFVPPFLGRRRGWMIICQVGIAAGAAAVAFSNPAEDLRWVLGAALFVAFCSASQDIVIDAYRAELLSRRELGAGAGIAQLGYRFGMITSGGLALILANQMPWRNVYLVMAALMAIGAVAALFGPEPELENHPPKSLREAVIEPFRDFFKRPLAVQLLLFVVLYKIGDSLAVFLLNQFLLGQGFDLTNIGVIKKWCGIIAMIVGSLIGGGVVARIGIKRALISFGLLQGAFIFTFVVMSLVGKSFGLLIFSVLAENLCIGLGTSAYIAFLMSICNKRFTATQYALLTSLAGMSRVYLSAPMGYVQKYVGWTNYFMICMGLAIPGILMAWKYYDRWAAEE